MSDSAGPSTVPDLLRWRAKRSPNAPAFAYDVGAADRAVLSWQLFFEQVDLLRNALFDAGLRPGDRLAIVAPVSIQWETLHHAAMALGAAVVGFDAHDSPRRVARMSSIADVSAFALYGSVAETVVGVEVLAQAKLVIDIAGGISVEGPHVLSWADLLAMGGRCTAVQASPSPNDVATIVFTSGTTGEPKGIAYSHAQLMLALTAIAEAFDFVDERGQLLCWLPLSNLFQRIVNLAAIKNGASSFLLGDPRRILDVVATVDPDVLIGVPRFFEKLLVGIEDHVAGLPAPARLVVRGAWALGRKAAEARVSGVAMSPLWAAMHRLADTTVLSHVRAVLGRRTRCLVSGSAPMPAQVLCELDALGWPFLEAYGLSENVLPMAMNRICDRRLGSAGRPLPGNEIRVEPDGAILVRGPGVFSGYLAETRSAASDAGGFHRTGDLGHIDSAGYLWLTGRSSDLIKTSTGRRVSPLGAESALRSVKGIDQALVVGDTRPFLVALCACEGPQGTDARRLLEQSCIEAIAALAPNERPRAIGFIERPFQIAAGEITANLKLRRQAVATTHAVLIESLYSALATRHSTAEGDTAFVW